MDTKTFFSWSFKLWHIIKKLMLLNRKKQKERGSYVEGPHVTIGNNENSNVAIINIVIVNQNIRENDNNAQFDYNNELKSFLPSENNFD